MNVVKLGGGGLNKNLKAWSTGNALSTPSGAPFARPGTRSLRSTLTSLSLITKPVYSSRSTHIICTMGPKCWYDHMREDSILNLQGEEPAD